MTFKLRISRIPACLLQFVLVKFLVKYYWFGESLHSNKLTAISLIGVFIDTDYSIVGEVNLTS